MAFGSDGLALLFTLKAKDEASGVVGRARGEIDREVKGVEATFQRLGQSVGLTNNQITGLTRSLPAVGAGLAVVGGGAVAVATGLFAMAKNASDAGSEIFDLKAKTGLGAESLSALKFAADQSGSSISELSQAFVIYQNKLTDAAAKGKDLFGIDARRALADQEFALRELTRVLNGPLPAGFSRSSLAAELMGRSGSNLIATFDTLGRDFDKFVAQAKRMGVVLSEEDVKAADEFGDSLTVLQTILGATSNKMALQFAPEMTKGMQQVADMMSRNKDVIVGVFKGIGVVIEQQVTLMRGWVTAFEALKNSLSGQSIASSLAGAIVGGGSGSAPGVPSPTGGAGGGTMTLSDAEVNEATAKIWKDIEKLESPLKAAIKDIDELRKKREQAAKEWQQHLERQADREEAARERTLRLLAESHAHELDMMRAQAQSALAIISDWEDRGVFKHAWAAEQRAVIDREEAAAKQRQLEFQLAAARTLKLDSDIIKDLERKLDLQRQLNSALETELDIKLRKARVEDFALPQGKTTLEGMGLPGVDVPGFGEAIAPPLLAEAPSMWENFKASALGALEAVGVQGATTQSILGSMFQGMAQGLQQSIQGFLLYGGSIGKALKQATAAVMAQIAAQAAVKAIFQLAEGFAALFWNPAAAAAHFKSAALYGAAALAAGVGARGLSGGGAGGYAGAAYAGGSSGNEDYRESRRSQFERETAERDRFTRREDRREEHVYFHVPEGWVVEKWEKNYRGDGRARAVVRHDILGESFG